MKQYKKKIQKKVITLPRKYKIFVTEVDLDRDIIKYKWRRNVY